MNNVFHALAHPLRRRVLALLSEGPMTAGELASKFEVSKPTMSGHFNVLKEADLVVAEREGTTIRYRLNASVVGETIAALMELFNLELSPDGKVQLAPRPESPKGQKGGLAT